MEYNDPQELFNAMIRDYEEALISGNVSREKLIEIFNPLQEKYADFFKWHGGGGAQKLISEMAVHVMSTVCCAAAGYDVTNNKSEPPLTTLSFSKPPTLQELNKLKDSLREFQKIFDGLTQTQHQHTSEKHEALQSNNSYEHKSTGSSHEQTVYRVRTPGEVGVKTSLAGVNAVAENSTIGPVTFGSSQRAMLGMFYGIADLQHALKIFHEGSDQSDVSDAMTYLASGASAIVFSVPQVRKNIGLSIAKLPGMDKVVDAFSSLKGLLTISIKNVKVPLLGAVVTEAIGINNAEAFKEEGNWVKANATRTQFHGSAAGDVLATAATDFITKKLASGAKGNAIVTFLAIGVQEYMQEMIARDWNEAHPSHKIDGSVLVMLWNKYVAEHLKMQVEPVPFEIIYDNFSAYVEVQCQQYLETFSVATPDATQVVRQPPIVPQKSVPPPAIKSVTPPKNGSFKDDLQHLRRA